MNVCLVLLGIVSGCLGAAPERVEARGGDLGGSVAPLVEAALPQAAADPWLAEDKLRHFGMSFAAGSFTYAAGRTLLDPDPALAVSAAAAVAAGVGKEWLDVRRGRPWSWKDLVWDAAGVTVALIISTNSR